MEAFVGIDLAFAKGKHLPVCLCCWKEERLIPVPLTARDAPMPPRGRGNAASTDSSIVASFADEVADYLHLLQRHFSVSIRRIAIDAPSKPRQECLPRRLAETALDRKHISCFATPSALEFEMICRKVTDHLKAGGPESRIPHANQLWMLVGFALFERLRTEWECLEVYPQATVQFLDVASVHKSKPDAVLTQLKAVSQYTGWPDMFSQQPLALLTAVVRARPHDGLDAYLSAWTAALEPASRQALGCPPDDAIWVPLLRSAQIQD